MQVVKHDALLKLRPGLDVNMIGREKSKFGEVVEAYLEYLKLEETKSALKNGGINIILSP